MSLLQLRAADLSVIQYWQIPKRERDCFARRGLIEAIVAVPGLIVLGQAGYVLVLDATSGQTLFSYGHDTPDNYSLFRGWASVSHGVICIGGTDGKLYAFSP